MAQRNMIKIFEHVRNHNITYGTVNQEDITHVALSDSRYERSLTSIQYYDFKIKGRKNGKTKHPSPRRQNRMLHAITHFQDISLQKFTRMEPPFLPFDKPNLYNDCIFMNPECDNRMYFFN